MSENFLNSIAFLVILLGIKRRLSLTMSKQDLQIYLKWKIGPNHLFLSQKKIQKESALTVIATYGSMLSLINVRSPSKV